MVRKIPKDRRGLYLSDPFLHGKQSHINQEEGTASIGAKKTMKKLPREERRPVMRTIAEVVENSLRIKKEARNTGSRRAEMKTKVRGLKLNSRISQEEGSNPSRAMCFTTRRSLRGFFCI